MKLSERMRAFDAEQSFPSGVSEFADEVEALEKEVETLQTLLAAVGAAHD